MKNFISFLFVFVLLNTYFSKLIAQKREFISVQTLHDSGKIKATFKSTGGYSGDCMSMKLENKTSDTALVWLESGRRLDNPDETAQDILLVKEQKIALPPMASLEQKIFGFCCQASNHAPTTHIEFGIGNMATGNLAWVAQFLNKGKYDTQTMQACIWVMSDNHNLGSIIADKNKNIIALKRAMADKLGIVLPWYDIFYKKEQEQVFSNKHERISGDVPFYSSTNGMVHINVRRQDGLLMSTLLAESGVSARGYTYHMDMNIDGWPSGKYYVNVYVDDNLKKRQEFIL